MDKVQNSVFTDLPLKNLCAKNKNQNALKIKYYGQWCSLLTLAKYSIASFRIDQ
jgi:hypothetical protein